MFDVKSFDAIWTSVNDEKLDNFEYWKKDLENRFGSLFVDMNRSNTGRKIIETKKEIKQSIKFNLVLQ